jgi:hypothetical protein
MRFEKPYSVLYAVDGEIYKSGPFLSFEETMDYIRKHSNKEFNCEFDLDEEYVYIMTPDHRLMPVSSEDITEDKKDEEV